MSNIDTLTIEEAKLYAAFKKNRAKFKIMLDHGLFDVEEGQIEINNHNGQIQTIFFHQMVYKRKKVINT